VKKNPLGWVVLSGRVCVSHIFSFQFYSIMITGGYANMDYFKFGAPMQIMLWLSSTAMLGSDMGWHNFYYSWLICIIGFVVLTAVRLGSDKWATRQQQKKQLPNKL
jgi:hypothetical protein